MKILYPEIIFKITRFSFIRWDTLLILLQNKKLNLKEVESIIRWGNYTNTSFFTNTCCNEMSDVLLWTKVKFRDLTNILKQFIPLIDFIRSLQKIFIKKLNHLRKLWVMRYFIYSPKMVKVIRHNLPLPASAFTIDVN